MRIISNVSMEKARAGLWYSIIALLGLYACNSSSASEGRYQQPMQALPVFTVQQMPATTYQEFSASIEGSRDIEIRPQVEGYLDRIYVDEGTHVRKGQVLFHINDRPYAEQLNTARAGLAAAKANLASARINLAKLAPLVENHVVSEVQLKTAQAASDAATANVAQAEAMVQSAEINLGFTVIKAPADGYIGRIPFKTGSLVGISSNEPLTVLSEIKEVYAYFSLSENDFLQFKNRYPGRSIEEKIGQMPAVELILADNTVYPKKGRVETVSGQFDNSKGSISFRAVFENTDGLLRSGNTGRIRLPHQLTEALLIPQEATFELQDKVFVFALGDSNKVAGKAISVAGRSGNYYLVNNGIKAGDKIVYAGLDRLQDGVMIQPQTISLDSLLKLRPL